MVMGVIADETDSREEMLTDTEEESESSLNSSFDTPSYQNIYENVVGQGNLSVLPLISGQTEIESWVILEPPGFQETLFFSKNYSQHPRLLVRLSDVRKNLSAIRLNNIMWMTVESIYNVDDSHFMEEASHTMVVPLPASSLVEEELRFKEMFNTPFQEYEKKISKKKTLFAQKGVKKKNNKNKNKTKTSKKKGKPAIKRQKLFSKLEEDSVQDLIVHLDKYPDFDLIQFDRGIYKIEPTPDIRKKWSSLANINGAPAMTSERIKTDGNDLMSTIQIDLRQKFRKEHEPRIEWNMIRPIWLHQQLERNIKNRIIQYGVWPFELLMMGKVYVESEDLPHQMKREKEKEFEYVERVQEKIDMLFTRFNKIVYNYEKERNNKNRKQARDSLETIRFKMREILNKHNERKIGYRQKRFEKEHSHRFGQFQNLSEESDEEVEEEYQDLADMNIKFNKDLTKNTVEVLEKKAYVAWVDLSPLLAPGCTHLRTAGLLQFFNEKEAMMKWGLDRTLSGEPDFLDTKDRDMGVVLKRDPRKLYEMYSIIERCKLLKRPISFLLLLGKLMDLRYEFKTEMERESKVRKTNEDDKKVRFDGSLGNQQEITRDLKLFNEFRKGSKQKTSFTLSSTEIDLKKKSLAKTSQQKRSVDESRNNSSKIPNRNTDIIFDDPKFKVGPHINRSISNDTFKSREYAGTKNSHKKIDTSILPNTKLDEKSKTKKESDKKRFTIREFKNTFGEVLLKYDNLRRKYIGLRSTKKKYRNKAKKENNPIELMARSKITRIEPMHKLWHFGKVANEDLTNKTDFQILRKLIVLQRKYLLLKRFKLTQMRNKWREEAHQIIPEYFINNDGEYVFVVIDIKLLKPLVPKPKVETIELNISEFVHRNKSNFTSQIFYSKDVVGDFENCVISLSKLISDEYQDFRRLNSTSSGNSNDNFYEYLEQSSAKQIISASLSEALSTYLTNTMGSFFSEGEKEQQNQLRYYVGWLHSRLADEMQIVVNKITLSGDLSQPQSIGGYLPDIGADKLFLFAVEAIEEMDYDRAKYYLLKRLEGRYRNDSQRWIDYAVIALRVGDYSRAVECIKEALSKNVRCKEGLVLYAVMLLMEGKFDDAADFFDALTIFHPMFIEGWIACHIFNLIIENKTGSDIALVSGTRIDRDYKTDKSYRPPQLGWDNTTEPREDSSYYISTAVYFLSFNLYEFAEVCLAQELDRVGAKTSAWVYYLSVCHYLQGRYEDSAKHLSKAIGEISTVNTEPRNWIMLGNNCWHMGMKKSAVMIYIQSFTRNEPDIHAHMTYIRCGYYFLENNLHEFAKQMFLRCIKLEGTPMSWLGLGIALFMEGSIDDAELALKEANTLDTTLATAWGYLALVSLHKLKQEHFLHCFREARRYGLKDKHLAYQIELINREITSWIEAQKINDEKVEENLQSEKIIPKTQFINSVKSRKKI